MTVTKTQLVADEIHMATDPAHEAMIHLGAGIAALKELGADDALVREFVERVLTVFGERRAS